MISGDAAVERLCDPTAEVSAHYVIHEDGRIARLVPEGKRAWHAGVSCWRGHAGLNDLSIGIEIVNQGHAHGLRPFPAHQMAALVELGLDIISRRRIAPAWIVGHSDVAPNRKLDPGELLDWAALARAGIGRFPERATPRPPDPAAAARLLERIGYPLSDPALPDSIVFAAFQRRYRPGRVDGRLDATTMGLIVAVERLLAAPYPSI